MQTHQQITNIANGMRRIKGIANDAYLQVFSQKMMSLSNRLNEVIEDEDNDMREDADIAEDYLPAIREFIANVSGL